MLAKPHTGQTGMRLVGRVKGPGSGGLPLFGERNAMF